MAAVAVATLLIAGSAFWGRTPPIVVVESFTKPEMVAPGESIFIGRKVRAVRPDCGVGKITSKFIDSHREVRQLQAVDAAGRPRSGDVGTFWMIPATMPAGDALYRSEIGYSCYPFFELWPVTMQLPDVAFHVKPGQSESRLRGFSPE